MTKQVFGRKGFAIAVLGIISIFFHWAWDRISAQKARTKLWFPQI